MQSKAKVEASKDGFFSQLCWGEAMAANTKPQKLKKEDSKRLRGERDQINLLILYLKEGKLWDSGKGEEDSHVGYILSTVTNSSE